MKPESAKDLAVFLENTREPMKYRVAVIRARDRAKKREGKIEVLERILLEEDGVSVNPALARWIADRIDKLRGKK